MQAKPYLIALAASVLATVLLVGLLVLALLAGFVGMGLWSVAATAWTDHVQIERNRTDVQAIVNYVNSRGGNLAPAGPPPAPPAEPPQ